MSASVLQTLSGVNICRKANDCKPVVVNFILLHESQMCSMLTHHHDLNLYLTPCYNTIPLIGTKPHN